jgi:hypothetical protein
MKGFFAYRPENHIDLQLSQGEPMNTVKLASRGGAEKTATAVIDAHTERHIENAAYSRAADLAKSYAEHWEREAKDTKPRRGPQDPVPRKPKPVTGASSKKKFAPSPGTTPEIGGGTWPRPQNRFALPKRLK